MFLTYIFSIYYIISILRSTHRLFLKEKYTKFKFKKINCEKFTLISILSVKEEKTKAKDERGK